jgi:predicted dehydrogenase
MLKDSYGYALIGAGLFGQFCLEQYQSLPKLKLVGVFDVDTQLAYKVGKEFKIKVFHKLEDLLKDNDVDFVHIATPPGSHFQITLEALRAGKHVLCEKPLALKVEEAQQMIAQARKSDLILAVNLIMRYNPLCLVVKDIIKKELLGKPLHAFLENYAKDEDLPPEHWFWDKARSGGIFIEHGVHFFDLFAMWFGEGKVVSAQQMSRRKKLIDQVQAICHYGDGVLVNFYHGFHQATRMDRQEFRIVCEKGDIRLYDWVPTHMEIDALISKNEMQEIVDIVPNAKIKANLLKTNFDKKVKSRNIEYKIDGRYCITGKVGSEKQELYGLVLRSLLLDQLRGVENKKHQRIITEENGLNSVMMACQADALSLSSATNL